MQSYAGLLRNKCHLFDGSYSQGCSQNHVHQTLQDPKNVSLGSAQTCNIASLEFTPSSYFMSRIKKRGKSMLFLKCHQWLILDFELQAPDKMYSSPLNAWVQVFTGYHGYPKWPLHMSDVLTVKFPVCL